jgi:SAM-dependent methyltransferase
MNENEVNTWVQSQDWYQKIELSNGIVTPGNVSVNNRLKYFNKIDVKNKSFLDIGCNSGGYCLWAKKNGADEVLGYDINEKRIEQAQKLSEIEKLKITYIKDSIFNIPADKKYDVVFCISVLTEISDFFGALSIIKNTVGGIAIIELALARPLLYLSTSKKWRSGYKTVSRLDSVMELHESKRGYMIAPTLGLVKGFFGSEYQIKEIGKGERYDMLIIQKR